MDSSAIHRLFNNACTTCAASLTVRRGRLRVDVENEQRRTTPRLIENSKIQQQLASQYWYSRCVLVSYESESLVSEPAIGKFRTPVTKLRLRIFAQNGGKFVTLFRVTCPAVGTGAVSYRFLIGAGATIPPPSFNVGCAEKYS